MKKEIVLRVMKNIMKSIIKNSFILSFIIFICFFISCNKKVHTNKKNELKEIIKDGKLGLSYNKLNDSLILNIKSLVNTSTEDYLFIFVKDKDGFTLIKENMFGASNISNFYFFNNSKIDTLIYQQNELYDSFLEIHQNEINDSLYRLFIREKPRPDKSIEILYDDKKLKKINLMFFEDKYSFDID